MHHAVRKLPIYHEAMDFAVGIDDLAEGLPAWRSYLKHQLRRASLSIVLNLTEGATETEPREKARMYRLARRSAAETAAGLEFTSRVVPAATPAIERLDHIASSLSTQLHHMIADQLRRSGKRSTRSSNAQGK